MCPTELRQLLDTFRVVRLGKCSSEDSSLSVRLLELRLIPESFLHREWSMPARLVRPSELASSSSRFGR